MDLRLARQPLGENAPAGLKDRDAGFIAAGFDSEDSHVSLYSAGLARLIFPAQCRPSRPLFLHYSIREHLMPGVRIRESEHFDAALRRFKRACEKAGILTELRRREFYEKPTQERKRKKAAAVKRHMKRSSRTPTRRRRLY